MPEMAPDLVTVKEYKMQATVDGVRWRLQFEHTPPELRQEGKHRKAGTICRVEYYSKETAPAREGWVTVSNRLAWCGRKDKFTKEYGRQFALVRALRVAPVTKPVKAQLIRAYLTSGQRPLCEDMAHRGYKSLYDCVFQEEDV